MGAVEADRPKTKFDAISLKPRWSFRASIATSTLTCQPDLAGWKHIAPIFASGEIVLSFLRFPTLQAIARRIERKVEKKHSDKENSIQKEKAISSRR